mmetsp:Transcript_21069/g.58048  ORF Transcript_21069/g.58048 Transcript_21069/m.58048 type:complete len:148 (+) Transcript_21069:164-607(+)
MDCIAACTADCSAAGAKEGRQNATCETKCRDTMSWSGGGMHRGASKCFASEERQRKFSGSFVRFSEKIDEIAFDMTDVLDECFKLEQEQCSFVDRRDLAASNEKHPYLSRLQGRKHSLYHSNSDYDIPSKAPNIVGLSFTPQRTGSF